MTEQTDAAEVEARIVRCPEHGEPLAIEGRGPDGAGPYFHAWICPACPNTRRCGSCGKAAPEAWSSGRCHGCYRVQTRRMEQERREREQADYDRAIAAAEARWAQAERHRRMDYAAVKGYELGYIEGAQAVLAAVEAAAPRLYSPLSIWAKAVTAARAAAAAAGGGGEG